jgi:hypothetical protein
MPIKPCPKPFNLKREGKGTVHKEELVEHLKRKDKDYYKMAQLLEWENDGWSIRIGYYLKRHGATDNEWHWGSQTTSIINIAYIDNLIKALESLKRTYEEMQERDEPKIMS